MLNFQIIGNTLPIKEYKNLLIRLKDLGKDFNFIAEARADQFKCDDYTLLKESGFTTIQTGIESFSQSYLKKMNKGTRVIDNIAALKFCRENDIKNPYNLIINYPNEDKNDFEQTKKNIQFLWRYLDPPNICQLRVVFESPIFCNQKEYNIEELGYTQIDKIMFPKNHLEKQQSFVFDFRIKENHDKNNWNELIDIWKKDRENSLLDSIRYGRDIDRFIFYFIDGENFIKIYDKRLSNNIQIYLLNKTERAVFLACKDIISVEKIKEKFNYLTDEELINIINSFVSIGIFYAEDNHFLSLPLDYRKCVGIQNKKHIESRDMKKEVLCSLN
jgi:hypothetical protein